MESCLISEVIEFVSKDIDTRLVGLDKRGIGTELCTLLL